MTLNEIKIQLADMKAQKDINKLIVALRKEWTHFKSQSNVSVEKKDKGWYEIRIELGKMLSEPEVRPDQMSDIARKDWEGMEEEIVRLADTITSAIRIESEVYYNDAIILHLQYPVTSKKM